MSILRKRTLLTERWRKLTPKINCGGGKRNIKMTSLASSEEFLPDLDETSAEFGQPGGGLREEDSGKSIASNGTTTRSVVSFSQPEYQVRELSSNAPPPPSTSLSPMWASLPPVHTCALIVGLLTFFLKNLPSLESLDQVATIGTFTNTNFDSLPLNAVIAIRLILASIMLGNASSVFLWGKWEADTDYFPGSKLTVAKSIPFRGVMQPDGNFFSGLKCISSFTLWCWILEGTAFLLAGMIPLLHQQQSIIMIPISPWILRIAIVLWETAAPVAILVSAVVKFALWPMAQSQGDGGNLKLLKAPGALLQHNLNSVAALVEVGLLGGLPVRMMDFALPPLYGLLYLLFSYAMMYSWTPNKTMGPQYFYPFFDTTLGITSSLCLIGLLAILSTSFAIFCGANSLLKEAPESQGAVPIAAILLLCMGVCRFWD